MCRYVKRILFFPSILAPREVLRSHFECYIAVCSFAKCLVSKPFSPPVSQPQVLLEHVSGRIRKPFDVRLLLATRDPPGGSADPRLGA